MKKTTKILAVFFAAVLSLTICACGAEADPNVGLYTCTKVQMLGIEMDPTESYPAGVTMELKNGGRGKIFIDGQGGAIKWELNGTDFTMDTDGEKSYGTLKNGILTLDLLESGVVMTLVRDGVEVEDDALPAKETAQPVQTDDPAYQQLWSGDWYGWWIIENSTGEFVDTWYDCCGSIELGDDGTALLTLWDEDTTRDEPMAVVQLLLNADGTGEMGRAESQSGWFWFDDVKAGEWEIDPGEYEYDKMLVIENGHHEGQGESFDYSIFLRPWGVRWDDVEAAEPDVLPYFYYDWYLPLIEAGEAMPDSISDAAEEECAQ